MGKIVKAVNVINSEASDLETKLRSLDMRVTETEKCCEVLLRTNETHKIELKTTKRKKITNRNNLKHYRKLVNGLKRKHKD